MKSDENGCSICRPGEEYWEEYHAGYQRRRGGPVPIWRVQYDYRHTDGELFSCVAPNLERARYLRNQWLAKKGDSACTTPKQQS